ncbi:MAG: hypothetical protein WA749_09460 [Gelidibacter sp.]
MKYFKVLFLAFTLTMMSSCSNDDDDNPVNNVKLLGTWKGVSVDYTSTTTYKFDGEFFVIEAVGRGYDVNYTITLAEPNLLTSKGAYNIELTSIVLGQTQVRNIENLEFTSDGTWSRNGNDLMIVADKDTQNFNITELSESAMTLVTEDKVTIVEQGVTNVVTIKLIATYKR